MRRKEGETNIADRRKMRHKKKKIILKRGGRGVLRRIAVGRRKERKPPAPGEGFRQSTLGRGRGESAGKDPKKMYSQRSSHGG